MIVDNLKNTEKHESLHPLFKQAFDYLKSVDFSAVQTGKTELQGEDFFVIVSDSDLRAQQEAKLEVHNRYIDIQMPVSKIESFGWKSRSDLVKPQQAFDNERDIQFFDDEYQTVLSLSPNRDFVIFFPEDAHAPCIGDHKIRKVVVKIKI